MLNDNRLNRDLRIYGYTHFKLLCSNQTQRLLNIFKEFGKHHQFIGESFKSSSMIDSKELKLQISKASTDIIAPFIEKKFQHYRIIGSTFLLKNKSDINSKVDFHQDWTYVDESKHQSMNVWIALEDIDDNNGGMFFIPKSHRIGKYIRSAPSYPVPFRKVSKLLNQIKQPVTLNSGECICFNNKTIHGSFPNLGNTNRLVLVCTLIPKDASLMHYFIEDVNQPKKITEYIVDNDVFLTLPKGKPPTIFKSRRKVTTNYPLYNMFTFKMWLIWLNVIDLFKK